jgi:hypothetical protein
MTRTINIALKPDTHERLSKLGSKKDTYDSIVVKLLDFYENNNNE